jgi:L-amino acid N-acyltransferase YncA
VTSIREATAEDARALQEIYAVFVLGSAISFEEEPPTMEAMASRIRKSHLWLVCHDQEDILGYAYASPFHVRAAYRWSTEVSIYLREDARSRGLGGALLDQLLKRLARRGFVNAFAGTTMPNPASVKLFESRGFKKVALWSEVGFKLGTWHDVAWWQLRLREPTVPPPRLVA